MPTPIPENVEIKDIFKERYTQLLGEEAYEQFIEISLSFLRRSIRVNTLKMSVAEVKKRLEPNWTLTPVPWCKEGFWIDHKGEGEEYRRDVGNLMEHQLGQIYIQESCSMIPPIVLDPKPGEKVLDMCASPGSKTTQIAQYMKNEGILIANDYKGDRIKPLGLNLQRCGLTNSLITLMHGHRFKDMQFDRVLVDAPCSGTGTIRKSLKTLKIYNPNVIKRIATQQKQLLQTGFDNLKPGGTLVYSTCTLEPDEDEAVISHFLDNNENAEICDIEVPGLIRGKPVEEFNGTTFNEGVKKCLRIWPQDNDTEGFFVTKIVKKR